MFIAQLFPRASMAFVCLALAAQPAHATATSYTIDSSLSVLNLNGSFGGLVLLPQSGGALSDHFGGTIVADFSGGALTFSGGSTITALLNPVGPFQPMTAGAAGTAPGNYGVVIPSIGELGAYRGLVFDIPSGMVMNGGMPAVTLGYTGGVLDYAGPATGPGQLVFAGLTGLDSAALPVTLTVAGGVETLTLPFTFDLSDPSGLQQTFDGQIVAFRPVPEPSPMVLGLASGVILLGFWRFRRRSQKRSQGSAGA